MDLDSVPQAMTAGSARSSSRSLLSKLTSPFATKIRNVADFYIKLPEDHRRYSPGNVVKGTVIVVVTKPVRVTHIVVCLHGYVRVLKTGALGDAAVFDHGPIGTGRGYRGPEYLGNGLASIFEIEKTLCGDGRLDVGQYEFRFELPFPSSDLPTSLDFEKGTITYMVTATLTRPTTISPTTTCDKKIHFTETIDVGPLSQPKPRKISLKPIVVRAKPNKQSAHLKTPASPDAISVSETGTEYAPDTSSNRSERSSDEGTGQSPLPSASSVVSTDSAAAPSDQGSFKWQSALSGKRTTPRASKVSLAKKTITATIELLRAGCLPGDVLPLKITINHTKPIRSMSGVIVTLYRQGRIDTHPVVPFPSAKGKSAAAHEDYYPPSRTGLGGLSLSAAGTCRTFRNDFTQSVSPLLIDPESLTAVIRPTVRIPVAAFPTISSVPGAMITFKYYVEVVIDLGGKLSSLLPRLGMIHNPTNLGHGAAEPAGAFEDANGNLQATFGGVIVDTAQIRRERSVVACTFEAIVGTVDSNRNRDRVGAQSPVSIPTSPQTEIPLGTQTPSTVSPILPSNHEPPPNPTQDADAVGRVDYFYGSEPGVVYEEHPVPAPELMADEALSEKDRIRLAEERHLPSSPPQADGSGPSSSLAPSAPNLDLPGSSSFSSGRGGAGLLAPSAPTIDGVLHSSSSGSGSSSQSRPGAAAAAATDDKEELERRRLQMEASQPSDFPDVDDDDEEVAGGPSAPPPQAPSAPVMHDEPEFGDRHEEERRMLESTSGSEGLPRYER